MRILVLSTLCFACGCGLRDAPDLEHLLRHAASPPLEARLTGISHPPTPGVRRGSRESAVNEEEPRHTFRRIRHRAVSDPSSGNLAELGLAQMVVGEVDEAIETLEEARRTAPEDPTILSDLAALLLHRGIEGVQPTDLLRALSAADQASALAPELPQAHFNRALALEELYLTAEAAREWKRYLELDPGSPWTTEAERHLRALPEPLFETAWAKQRLELLDSVKEGRTEETRTLVRQFTQAALETAQDELLSRWAEAQLGGRSVEADRWLRQVEAIAAAVSELADEHLLAESVKALRSAAGDAPRLLSLAEGHAAFGRGKALYERLRTKEAVPELELATAKLAAAGSPFRWLSDYYLVLCRDFWARELERSLSELERILADSGDVASPSLKGHLHWMLGLIHGYRGEFGLTIEHYRTALEALDAARQDQSRACIHHLLAQVFDHLGDQRQALWHQYRALSLSPWVRKTRWIHTIFSQAASYAGSLGFLPAAVLLQDHALEAALASGNPGVISEALLKRATLLERSELRDLAVDDLEQAGQWLERVDDPNLSRLVTAQRWLLEAKTFLDTRPQESLRAASRARDYYAEREGDPLVIEPLLAEGRAHLALGERGPAEESFQRGAETFERNRNRIPSRHLRVSYFERAREIYDELVRLELAEDRPDIAFDYAERGRAREVLDALVGTKTQPSAAAGTIQRSLPDGVVLVQYTSLADRLLAWVVTRRDLRLIERSVGADELKALVEGLLWSIHEETSGARLAARAAELYQELIAPLADAMPEGEGAPAGLVVVPDKALHALPFSALYHRETSKYLIEEHSVVVAPSATFFLHSLAAAQERGGRPPATALIIGNPEIDHTVHPDLYDLPGAGAEALKIAEIYGPGSRVWIGPAATKARFLAAAPSHDVIHFAGHALVNREYPLRSQLVLAPDGDDRLSGALFADEIYATAFGETRLVVLAACSTGVGPISSGEGVQDLARPFLAAGVPSVVASLWDIRDAESTLFFERFHRHLKSGEAPAEALRKAQVSMIRSPDEGLRSPRIWAAFQLLGASAQSPRVTSQGESSP